MYVSSKLVLFVTIVSLCLVSKVPLSARTLFMSMAMLNNVQFLMTQLMPRVASLGVESLVSLARMRDFLLLGEFSRSPRLRCGRSKPSACRKALASSNYEEEGTEDIDGANNDQLDESTNTCSTSYKVLLDCQSIGVKCPGGLNTMALEGITLRCDQPCLTLICGEVASGKSSLFMALLNEMPISEGRARVHGRCGFASQTPWIFNGTVRENIICGGHYDPIRYSRVLDACALCDDLELLDFGDLTYIQDNCLSGGQQARVNLARCLYRECEIYLLDDPFSALDKSVAEHIFEKAILDFLKGKIVLLATHQVGLIKRADKVLLLDSGKQVAFGSLKELKAGWKNPKDSSGLRRCTFLKEVLDDETGPDNNIEQEIQTSVINGDLTHESANESANEVHHSIPPRAEGKAEQQKSSEIGEQTEVKSFSVPQPTKQVLVRETSACHQSDTDGIINTVETAIEFATNRVSNIPRIGMKWPRTILGGPTSNCQKQDYWANVDNDQTDGREMRGVHTIHAYGQSNEQKSTKPSPLESHVHAPNGLSTKLQPDSSEDSISGERGAKRESDSSIVPVAASEPGGSLHASNRKQELEIEARVVQGPVILGKVAVCNEGRKEIPTLQKNPTVIPSNYRAPLATCGEAKSNIQTARTDSIAVIGDDGKKSGLDITSGCLQMNQVEQQQGEKDNHQREDESHPESVVFHEHTICTVSKQNGKEKQIGASERKLKANQEVPSKAMVTNGPVDEALSSDELPSIKVWYQYYTQTSKIRFVCIVVTFLITQALFSTVDVYLTTWTLSEQNRAIVAGIALANQQLANKSNNHQHRETLSKLVWPGGSNNQTDADNSLTIPYHQFSHRTMAKSSLTQPDPDSECISGCHRPDAVKSNGRRNVDPVMRFVGIESESHDLFTQMAEMLFYIWPSRKSQFAGEGSVLADKLPSAAISQALNTTNGNISQIFSTIGTIGSDRGVMSNCLGGERNFFSLPDSNSALNVKWIYRPLYLIVWRFKSSQHALTYASLLVLLFLSSAVTNILSLTSSNKSAVGLYKKLAHSGLFAKLQFFDKNPPARFLNRATRDIGIIDESIPYNSNQAYDALLQTSATFLLVVAVELSLIWPSLIILFIFLIFQTVHVKPTKDIQRLEGISRSPIISHITTTLAGSQTIRSSKWEQTFEQMFMRYQDEHSAIFLLYLGCNRSLGIVLDGLNATYIGIIAFWAVLSGLAGPSAGLIITSAMLLSGLTQHGVMKLTETASLMTSVERVIEYCNLPQEENYDSANSKLLTLGNSSVTNSHGKANEFNCKKHKKLPAEWPNQGLLEYRNVDLYYNRSPDSKPVLKNLSFRIEPGEKVGIIGRTGAGKSSIITTLFRLYDYEGEISIDGHDIAQMDLIRLRSSIGIIPQNPILFSTSIRKNLDPFERHSDCAIWSALEKAHLRETISALPGKLDYIIGGGGGGAGRTSGNVESSNSRGGGGSSGFSSGQKQLICLARVLLRQNKLLVLDEATANVDPSTDAIIQATIRREFKTCTVLTIAHRLDTILDCDRIMIMDSGRLVEFDTPERLLAAKSSNGNCFSSLPNQETVAH